MPLMLNKAEAATLLRERPNLVQMRDNPRPRHQKYRNERTVIDGVTFDSRAEARRWLDLKQLLKGGVITNLQRQVRYVLIPKQPRPSGGFEREKAYVADFVYVDAGSGRVVVEDVKGAEPAIWAWKRALMLQVHGIEVRVVRG